MLLCGLGLCLCCASLQSQCDSILDDETCGCSLLAIVVNECDQLLCRGLGFLLREIGLLDEILSKNALKGLLRDALSREALGDRNRFALNARGRALETVRLRACARAKLARPKMRA